MLVVRASPRLSHKPTASFVATLLDTGSVKDTATKLGGLPAKAYSFTRPQRPRDVHRGPARGVRGSMGKGAHAGRQGAPRP